MAEVRRAGPRSERTHRARAVRARASRVSRGRLGKAPTTTIRRGINATDPDFELLHTDTIHKVLKVHTCRAHCRTLRRAKVHWSSHHFCMLHDWGMDCQASAHAAIDCE